MRREGILGEVRDFLDSLALELPLVFSKPRPAETPTRIHRHLPYRGQDVPLRLVEAPELGTSELVHADGWLTLRRGRDRALPQAVLREWLADRARETFALRCAFWAPKLGVRYGRIAIRDQRSVWGSASRAGNLNFNWRVMMAPPEVLDYLVIHELAHLREMNHSKRFWAIVAEHSPDWKRHRDWLREHSRRLKTAVRRG